MLSNMDHRGQRHVTVVFESQEDVDRWESVFKLLVERQMLTDVIRCIWCRCMADRHGCIDPPGRKIELHTPDVKRKFIQCGTLPLGT